jgi:general secretion pathway protein A
MYTEFFGLTEKPFALAPDPRYLFLAEPHREALAHLLYGIEQGEGFIEVIGQVGTGKTTLCRALLGRIGDAAEIAFVFNPSPSEIELLASICRELGLPTVARSRTDLIDELNRFLLAKNAQGRKVLLVIDEAQNLDPGVLEQVRLLSNLETEREKLLQIVLIGQPELEESLSRPELRQLRQRITVRWRLRTFRRAEVAAYLDHRLEVAGLVEPDVFTRGAVRVIHRASSGTPRLINAIADRSLLAAYTQGRRRVTARMAKRAAAELPASAPAGAWAATTGLRVGVAFGLVALGIAIGFVASALVPSERTASAGRMAGPVQAPAPVPVSAVPIDTALVAVDAGQSAAAATDALLRAWGYTEGVPASIEPSQLPEVVRGLAPLEVLRTRRLSREALRRLDLPALLEVEASDGAMRYVALLSWRGDETVRVRVGDVVVDTDAGALDRMWTGRSILLWKNHDALPELSLGTAGAPVRTLRTRLDALGFLPAVDPETSIPEEYDDSTAEAVRSLQEAFALEPTGAVGASTRIALYRALGYEAPRLFAPARDLDAAEGAP